MSAPDPHPDGLAGWPRTWAAVTVIVALAVAVLDGSIANLALPSIAAEMQITPAQSIWIVNSYHLALAVCLLPLASLGEVVGYRKVYLAGLAAFTLASFACAMATGLLSLSLARMFQGVGAAGILSVNIALVRFIYPARLLGRAIGANALVAGAASSLGPTVAGLILQHHSWHGLFLINVPLGVAAMALGYFHLPFNALAAHRYDLRSAILCAIAVALLLGTINALGHRLGPAWLLLLAVSSAGALMLLLKLQSRQAPMLPVDLLKLPLFALSVGTSICSFAALTAAYVVLPFFFRQQLSQSAAHAGLLLTAWPAAIGLTALVAGRLADRMSVAVLGALGLALLTTGLLSLASVDSATTDVWIALRLVVCGIGFGLFQSPNNRTLISAATPARSGAASGMLGIARLFGQTAGASTVALLLGLAVDSFSTVLYIAAGLAGLACVVSWSRSGHSFSRMRTSP